MKFKNIFLFFLTVVMSLINTNCSNSVAPHPTTTVIDTVKSYNHFLWPAKIGTYWIYDRYLIPDTGNFDSSWSYKKFSSFGVELDSRKIKPIFF